ncbi:MAG: type I pullulanase, partial [Bacillota bacterium]
REYPMNKEEDGTFFLEIPGDQKGRFYTYIVQGKYEVTDPYSIASSCNSLRSAIIDLEETNPEGWEGHWEPYEISPVDAIIYETHIKDFTSHKTSGIQNKGTYIGMGERRTRYGDLSTGIDHLVELGITHVHLLPVYDFLTTREEREYAMDEDNYNWGYDPELYNVPEGSYSTDPHNPATRIKELKTLVMALHQAGLKVVLDVVYNHTFRGKDSNFNILAPDYYYRIREDGSFSNGSGVGNELDTQKPMTRRFILESLEYWLKEFRVDGFRFDLMALIDIDTVEEAVRRLRRIKSDVIIYGEPWMSGISTLPSDKTTSKGKQGMLHFALFNDNFREAIKGDNDGFGKGFALGNLDEKLATETGIAGSIFFDESRIGFTSMGRETINYANSHDNLILQDKLLKVLPHKTKEELKSYTKFVHAILILSQGVPFLHAGNEFLRTKAGWVNTYNAPLSINSIDWSLKEENLDVFHYIRDLIRFRKERSEFRMDKREDIKRNLKYIDESISCPVIAYTIRGNGGYLLVIHNANSTSCLIPYAAVKKHIQAQDERTVTYLSIHCLFNKDGYTKGETESRHPYGIEISSVSTEVFELKIR